MTNCERCRDAIEGARHVLTHVSYAGVSVSQMRSKMVVCSDCHDEMEDDPKWDW